MSEHRIHHLPSERLPIWMREPSPIDPADPAFFSSAERFDIWRQARRLHPIAWTKSQDYGDFWSVTTHNLARSVLQNTKEFTSTKGMRLGGTDRAVALASGRMLVVTDGVQHRRLRAAHSSWLSTKIIDRLSFSIGKDITELIETLTGEGEVFDAVEKLGVIVARQVLGRALGIPTAHWAELGALTDAAYATNDSEKSAKAHGELLMYLYDLLEQRRKKPQDDFVTALSKITLDGRQISDDEILLNCDGLLSGGLETTPLAVTGALVAFAQNPHSWQDLRQNPQQIESAVEEILRWTSPPAHVMRTAIADTNLGEARIRAGDRVVIWIPCANRDETVFVDPEKFIVSRGANPHLSFGGGPHYCVGGVLARLEIRCLLVAMVRVVDSIAIAGREEYRASNFLHGHKVAEVSFVADPTELKPGPK